MKTVSKKYFPSFFQWYYVVKTEANKIPCTVLLETIKIFQNILAGFKMI